MGCPCDRQTPARRLSAAWARVSPRHRRRRPSGASWRRGATAGASAPARSCDAAGWSSSAPAGRSRRSRSRPEARRAPTPTRPVLDPVSTTTDFSPNARVVGRLRNGFCNGRRRRSGLGRRVVVVVDGREGRADAPEDVRGPRGVVAAAGQGALRPAAVVPSRLGPVPPGLPRGQALVPGGWGGSVALILRGVWCPCDVRGDRAAPPPAPTCTESPSEVVRSRPAPSTSEPGDASFGSLVPFVPLAPPAPPRGGRRRRRTPRTGSRRPCPPARTGSSRPCPRGGAGTHG